ncbi:aldo/keto reductase [Halostella sp. JP-L12]|uniref:aldo/keto reductase n=1 Tax=Halostella TaxID=1843185 RepID=UPI000EF7B78B|nr:MULTISPECIES: aldo/keto reductase [Halostella]NHN47711.1 aldo/keto reductase [Halostella sp. JP-L12]
METVTAQGVEVPALGLGTARMEGEECRRAVETALDLGYRHVDTAQMYENEEAVGAAIRDHEVDRDDVFLVTKVHPSNLAREDVFDSFEGSLDRLGVEYVDLLLIHAPRSYADTAETLGAMNELQEAGSVEHVGVSNFSAEQLEEAIAASATPVVTDQMEYHPYNEQTDLLSFCIEEDVLLTAYSPLGKGKIVDDETLAEIGERYDKTPSQVALRWLLQQENVAAIPKASSEEHLRENAAVFDFELTNEEMEAVFELQGGLLDRLRSVLGL